MNKISLVWYKKKKEGKNTLSKSERKTVLLLASFYPGLNGGFGDYTIAGLAWGRSSRIEGKVAPWQYKGHLAEKQDPSVGRG